MPWAQKSRHPQPQPETLELKQLLPTGCVAPRSATRSQTELAYLEAAGSSAEGAVFGAAGTGVLVKARVAVGGSPAAVLPLEGVVGVAVALPAGRLGPPLTLTSPLVKVAGDQVAVVGV